MTSLDLTQPVAVQSSHPPQTHTTRVQPAPSNTGPAAIATTTATARTPVALLGIPFDAVNSSEAVDCIARMIASGRPHYPVTANVDFTVQALADVELRRILAEADLVLCDGMPLVWASRLLGNPLPERVAGSDLVPRLLAESERRGWRVFLLGGTDSSLARAADNVRSRHPNLQLVGTYSPPFRPLLEMDHEEILDRVRAARPDILLVSFGCPKQEKWINMHFRKSGVPVSIGVGATIDFLAGSVRRAPRWMQRFGLEWIFRLLQEPRRLFRRYFTGLWVFSYAILRQAWQMHSLRRSLTKNGPDSEVVSQGTRSGQLEIVRFSRHLAAATIEAHAELWSRLADGASHVLMDLSQVEFADSTGIGLLLRLQKQLRSHGRHLVLIAPAKAITRALSLMRLSDLIPTAPDLEAARTLVQERAGELSVVTTLNLAGPREPIAWQGDIVAANIEQVWLLTRNLIEHASGHQPSLDIDLSAVRFIDSAGVRLMVRTRKQARSLGIHLRFTHPQPAVRNVLRILRMEEHLLA